MTLTPRSRLVVAKHHEERQHEIVSGPNGIEPLAPLLSLPVLLQKNGQDLISSLRLRAQALRLPMGSRVPGFWVGWRGRASLIQPAKYEQKCARTETPLSAAVAWRSYRIHVESNPLGIPRWIATRQRFSVIPQPRNPGPASAKPSAGLHLPVRPEGSPNVGTNGCNGNEGCQVKVRGRTHQRLWKHRSLKLQHSAAEKPASKLVANHGGRDPMVSTRCGDPNQQQAYWTAAGHTCLPVLDRNLGPFLCLRCTSAAKMQLGAKAPKSQVKPTELQTPQTSMYAFVHRVMYRYTCSFPRLWYSIGHFNGIPASFGAYDSVSDS